MSGAGPKSSLMSPTDGDDAAPVSEARALLLLDSAWHASVRPRLCDNSSRAGRPLEGYKLLGAITEARSHSPMPSCRSYRRSVHAARHQIIASLSRQPAGEVRKRWASSCCARVWVHVPRGAGRVLRRGAHRLRPGGCCSCINLAEAGLMPWVVASPTVPLLAIAPMWWLWAGKARLPLCG